MTGLADPARATVEIIPLRAGDHRVLRIVELMIAGEWGPTWCARLQGDWGVSKNAVETYATHAGQYLRLQRIPEQLLETGLAQLRAIAEREGEGENPGVAVAAWKTILDKLEKLVEWSEKRKNAAAVNGGGGVDIRALLLDPPAELAALLEECGWRRAVATSGDG